MRHLTISMAKMLAVSLVMAVSIYFSSNSTAQAGTCAAQDSKLGGAYELIDVHETGSIIYLMADGRFGYELTVGAYDERAIGCWIQKGSIVTLHVKQMRVNDGDRKFEKLRLKLNSDGKLVRDHQGKKWGTYQRVKKF